MAGLIIAWQREQREAESINSAEVAPGRLAGTRQGERERREEKSKREGNKALLVGVALAGDQTVIVAAIDLQIEKKQKPVKDVTGWGQA